jgi:hypothetical protein
MLSSTVSFDPLTEIMLSHKLVLPPFQNTFSTSTVLCPWSPSFLMKRHALSGAGINLLFPA